ncbi:MAG: protein translocase SEC61 complex subunit gamma [Halobacteria archaeon]
MAKISPEKKAEKIKPAKSGKFDEYLRILKLTRKPTLEEFNMIAKVAALGLLIIGFIGFIIYLIMVTIPELLMRK